MIRFYAIAVALSVCLFLSKNTFAQFVPPDLNSGDMYHLVFVTEGKADATVGRGETATLVDYDAFVQGMVEIGELGDDLQTTARLCKSGREQLAAAKVQAIAQPESSRDEDDLRR